MTFVFFSLTFFSKIQKKWEVGTAPYQHVPTLFPSHFIKDQIFIGKKPQRTCPIASTKEKNLHYNEYWCHYFSFSILVAKKKGVQVKKRIGKK